MSAVPHAMVWASLESEELAVENPVGSVWRGEKEWGALATAAKAGTEASHSLTSSRPPLSTAKWVWARLSGRGCTVGTGNGFGRRLLVLELGLLPSLWTCLAQGSYPLRL